jgi:hypothetical protein
LELNGLAEMGIKIYLLPKTPQADSKSRRQPKLKTNTKQHERHHATTTTTITRLGAINETKKHTTANNLVYTRTGYSMAIQ